MAFAAGQNITAEALNRREATTIAITDSATFTTTETLLDTVTATLVAGRTYRVRWSGGLVTTVAGDVALIRMRENDMAGTLLVERNFYLGSASSGGFGMDLEGEFTATSSGDKTFVVTGTRNGGTGTHHADGTVTRPRYLYVDDIR